jgi:chorismate synthase
LLRYLTAGESHGRALVGILEGIPAQVRVSSGDIAAQLSRRRAGFGRGARMAFETDEVTILGGIRHGLTLGSPVAIQVGNSEWPKWEQVMSPDPVDEAVLQGLARNAPLTRPRPGHADLPGMQKYRFDEARPVLERASARETAMKVALGTVARLFLEQAAEIQVLSHTVELAGVVAESHLPEPADLYGIIDGTQLRTYREEDSQRMIAAIGAVPSSEDSPGKGDTYGGVIEVLAYGLPPGLGSHVQPDRRLDAKLAGAFMGIQAIKAVEFGDGFELAALPGSQAHDEIFREAGRIQRKTNHAGGVEGGMSNGEVLRARLAMKPIATVPRALWTIDTTTGEPAQAHHQRSDITAVPAAGVVAEAACALVLAEVVLEKFGGDSLAETKRNIDAYRADLAARGLS